MPRILPPRPADMLAKRLGITVWYGEKLAVALRWRYPRLWVWPLFSELTALLFWLVIYANVSRFFALGRNSPKDSFTALLQLAPFVIGAVVFFEIAKRISTSLVYRKFFRVHIDTPACLACGYSLAGIGRAADGELRCPECNDVWPWLSSIPNPRPVMAALHPPRQPSPPPSA